MFVLCYNAAERQSITGNDDVEYSGVGLFIPLEVFEMPKGNPEGSPEENLEKKSGRSDVSDVSWSNS